MAVAVEKHAALEARHLEIRSLPLEELAQQERLFPQPVGTWSGISMPS